MVLVETLSTWRVSTAAACVTRGPTRSGLISQRTAMEPDGRPRHVAVQLHVLMAFGLPEQVFANPDTRIAPGGGGGANTGCYVRTASGRCL